MRKKGFLVATSDTRQCWMSGLVKSQKFFQSMERLHLPPIFRMTGPIRGGENTLASLIPTSPGNPGCEHSTAAAPDQPPNMFAEGL